MTDDYNASVEDAVRHMDGDDLPAMGPGADDEIETDDDTAEIMDLIRAATGGDGLTATWDRIIRRRVERAMTQSFTDGRRYEAEK